MNLKHLFLPLFLLVFSPFAGAADVSPDAMVDQLLGDQKNAPDAAVKRASLQKDLVLQNALIAEAQKQGITQAPEFATRLELARRSLIVELYWRAFGAKHPIDNNRVKAAYEQLKTANGGKQFHVRQIFTDSQAAAKQAMDALARKEAFEAVAGKYSQDRPGNANGGDMGWRLKTNFIGPVGEALPKLKPGEVTPVPIELPNGFVILKLEEVRDFPDFESTRQQIANAMFLEIQQAELKRLQAEK